MAVEARLLRRRREARLLRRSARRWRWTAGLGRRPGLATAGLGCDEDDPRRLRSLLFSPSLLFFLPSSSVSSLLSLFLHSSHSSLVAFELRGIILFFFISVQVCRALSFETTLSLSLDRSIERRRALREKRDKAMEAARREKAIEHEIGGLQNDTLRFGLHSVKSEIVESHPLQSAYQSTKEVQEQMKRRILVNTYGSAFPLKMDLDRQMLSSYVPNPVLVIIDVHPKELGIAN